MTRRGKQGVFAMGLAAILGAYMFLLVPFVLYLGNVNEFTVSFGSILQFYTLGMIIIIGGLGLIGLLLPTPGFRKYVTLLSVISILFYIQGNLLVWNYGLLDGRDIDWSRGAWRGWVDSGIWSVGALLVMTLTWRISRRIITFAVIIAILQLLFLFFNIIYSGEKLSSGSRLSSQQQSPSELFRFSSTNNVLHILADGFQSDVFEDIIRDGDEGARITAALDGFVFYRNHLGVFPYTHMSVPAFLSTKIYKNKQTITKFMDSTIRGKTIFNAAYDAGYELDLAVPSVLKYMYEMSRYTNLYTVPEQYHISEASFGKFDAARLLDLTLFRLSPHFLKKFIYNDQLWLLQSLLVNKKYMGLNYFSHKAFLHSIGEHIIADRKRPVYKYLHLMLSHNPMVTNRQCRYAGRVLPTVRENVRNQARCSLIELVGLFEAMKKIGIFDGAFIVLMADHGTWVAPKGLTGIALPGDDTMEVMSPSYVGWSMPLLAIKRPGASGPLRISNAPSWIIDTPKTIADGMHLAVEFTGRSVFDLGENEQRDRRFYAYQYQRSEWTDEYLSPIVEFKISGRAVDTASWQSLAAYLPGNIEESNIGKTSLRKTVKIRKRDRPR